MAQQPNSGSNDCREKIPSPGPRLRPGAPGSPQGRGAGEDFRRASGIPIRNPSCDADENPLTPTLSPQGRGEGVRRGLRSCERSAVKQPIFWKSVTHAVAGLVFTLRTQRNARIHLGVAVAAIALALWLGLELLQLGILVLTIGAVLAGETINTTVESIVDLLSPEWHERAKIAKDVSAGAVLILSLTAVVVGLLILGPPLWQRVLLLFAAGG